MQTARLSIRAPHICKAAKLISKPRPTTTRTIHTFPPMASLIPRFPTGDFAPLFRLLDDYDTHRATSSVPSAIRAFQPRFDVREDKTSYQLQGELPGLEQKDIQIEFSDPQTLVIKGRVEREHTERSDDSEKGKRVTEEGEENGYHKPSVEDEGAETSVAKAESKEVAKKDERPKFKYWVSERSVGEFHRSFSFPGRVDQDAVKASLKNGILSVVVPKSVQKETRKITVE